LTKKNWKKAAKKVPTVTDTHTQTLSLGPLFSEILEFVVGSYRNSVASGPEILDRLILVSDPLDRNVLEPVIRS
jgi:hypothetical protein